MYCSRVIRVPFAAAAVVHGTDSPDVIVRFRETGWVTGLAVSAGPGDTSAGPTALGLQVLDDGGHALTLDHQRKAGFALFDNLAPLVSPARGMATMPLVVPVKAGETWRFTVRNKSAASDYTPQASLFFVPMTECQPGIRPAAAFGPLLAPCTRVCTYDVESIAAGVTSSYGLVEYPEDCDVVGFRASPIDNSLVRGGMSVELYDTECEQSITTNGSSGDFVPINLACMGPEIFLPIHVRRSVDKHHRVRVKNISAATTFTSQVAFFIDGALRRGR